MSLLQEYQSHKNTMSTRKVKAIDEYIALCKQEGKEISYNQIIYNPAEFKKFESWFYAATKIIK